MYDPRLPHGDPGVHVTLTPLVPAIGPLYFNENVQPDPTCSSTSVDGGVTWINIPPGEYTAREDSRAFLLSALLPNCECSIPQSIVKKTGHFLFLQNLTRQKTLVSLYSCVSE
jgi:hypothetical protein